ncbi:MAG: DUF2264 domain-containing protein [Spirochaetes bacterium]|nr:DUF2264 domain-containing protein [Spirochaetota bacterium]
MINKILAENSLSTRQDLEDAFLEMLNPYLCKLSPGKASVDPGTTAAIFSERAAGLEGFSRLLWGIVPFLKGTENVKKADELTDIILKGISCGTDPDHKEFWGIPDNYDQVMVEMGAFAYALLMVPEKIWDPLDNKQKQNFSGWLQYINDRNIPDCNWVFFRILVNAALVKLGITPVHPELLSESLKIADSFYLDENGWYNDGYPDQRRARDYYVPWAMHFYGMVFSAYCEDLYPGYAEKYKRRALEYYDEFSRWFDSDGRALPFGRSLTYRFAQCSFWGAIPLAFNDGIDWSRTRGLFASNMRWWFNQSMFDGAGLLSVGYCYPNQYMAERYNSANSPLWAFKSFAPLALKENHPFWKASELRPSAAENALQQSTGMFFCTRENTGHLHVLSAGQWIPGIYNEHLHMAEKYAKFAYSAYFGFNVVTDGYGIDKMAADNMLLLGEDEDEGFYRYRKGSIIHEVKKDCLRFEWKPFHDVKVDTWLLPINEGRWHIRIHKIKSERTLFSAEGGFPLGFNDDYYPVPNFEDTLQENQAFAITGLGASCIAGIGGSRKGYLIPSCPNANIMFPRSLVPVLKGKHRPGEFLLVCAVSANPDPGGITDVPEKNDFINIIPEEIRQLMMEN